MCRVIGKGIVPDLQAQFLAYARRDADHAVAGSAAQSLFQIGQPRPISGQFIVIKGAAGRPPLIVGQLRMDLAIEQIVR